MSTPPPPPHIPAGPIALFLDIDGTLLEHHPHPDGVRVDDELRALLDDAVDRLDGAVAFVTGRSVEMVDRLFAPLSLPTAGLYCLEHRLQAGGPVERATEPDDLKAVADALLRQFETTEGVYFERKGPVLAIHTRAAPTALPLVKAASEEALKILRDGYRLVIGHAGLEFLPVEALKSAAIERFMALPEFAGRHPVFLGDDVSDEAGFDYVNRLGGLSIRVRPEGGTAAQASLPNVAAVRRWLVEAVKVAGQSKRPGRRLAGM